jgi:electron transport complex protein RnfB
MTISALAERIDALLPQTQCTRCGYRGCLPYAEALAADAADIDQCPPGGEAGVANLARLLGRAPKPVNPANGAVTPPRVAVIDEAVCIGCTKCIQACPVDAIVGASKRMHTVIAAWCTGCELCVPPCPVDCIAFERTAALPAADLSRERHRFHALRLEREEREHAERLAAYE